MSVYLKIQHFYRNLRMLQIKYRYENLYKNQKIKSIYDIVDTSVTYKLFITTDNKGGTLQFENNFINDVKDILILKRISYGERPDVIFYLENPKINKRLYLHAKELYTIFSFQYSQIIVNSLVHISNIQSLLNMIALNKKTFYQTRIMYFLHDYHSICLNVNLFVNDHYCNLNCDNECCKLMLSDKNISISDWRKMWSDFFSIVDEIRCFSESSKKIFLIAYPLFKEDKINVVPHKNSNTFVPIVNVSNAQLHIGIIGNVKPIIKGGKVVKMLLKKYGDSIPITLIGASYKDFKICKNKIRYLGNYKQNELSSLVQKNGINFVIFPSVCPETFSYVISEVMEMKLPIACFNIGAQGERVSEYENGILCDDFEDLCNVIERIYNKNR